MKNNTHATQCYNIITVKIVYQILNIVSNLNAFSPNSYYMPCACVWELCHLSCLVADFYEADDDKSRAS